MHETLNTYLDIISCHMIFCNTVQDFKTNEPLSKKKFSFLFLLKSWENENIAFCIITDDLLSLKIYPFFLFQEWVK